MSILYIRVGDYYIPDLTLPEETCPIGKWERMHRDYLREYKPIQYNCLLLFGKLWTYLADLNSRRRTGWNGYFEWRVRPTRSFAFPQRILFISY